MAKGPPPLPRVEGDALPIDKALGLSLAGDHEGALRIAAALVKQQLDAPLPLYTVGRILADLGERAAAVTAFQLAAARAEEAGNLPLAVAGFSELRRLGEDTAARIDAAARAYARGGSRLKTGPVVPPSIGARQQVSPLPGALSGKALVDEAVQILDYAKAALDEQGATDAALLSPQRLFSSLGADASAAMMRACEARVVAKGAVLIEEGTTGEEAFLLARGEVEVSKESADGPLLLARLGAGALFGEMALLARAPRAATVKAAVPSVVLEIKEGALSAVAEEAPEVGAAFAAYCRRRMVENLLRTSPMLSTFKDSERAALMESFVTKSHDTGEKVISQGDTSGGLHLIASGQVVIQRTDGADTVVITRLGVGEVVGEVAMILRRPANADVVAEKPTVTMHLPQDGFMGLVREHPTLLAQLYELAVKRDEETTSIVAQEAAEADDLII